MKRLTNIMALALICAAMACNDSAKTDSIESKADSSTAATASTTDETPTAKDSAAMMKAWMDYMTPGSVHALLAKDNGTWDADITMWMTPDAPPQKSTGTCTFKMIMGGRYQQGNFKGSFNGMPFEGVSTTGYDNAKKAIVGTWIDNMGTGIMNMEGTYDSANNVINLSGKSIDPTTGKDCTMRQVMKRVDENTIHEEMYAKYQGGKEYKSMEMTYKRKK
jgi:hypothetical protein